MKMPKRFLPRALLVATLAVYSAVPLEARAEFVVGVAAPFTGPHTQIGRSIRNGAALALEIAEDSGKFGDVKLSIRAVDDAGTPKEVAERIVKFVRDETAILIIGPTLSMQAEAAADLANHAKFPLLAPGTSEGINATGKWAFRLSMSPYRTIQALATAAVAGGSGKSVALLHMQGNRGYAAQAAEFRAAAVRSGASIAAEVPVNIADPDVVDNAVKAIRAAGADVVFFAMDAEPGAAIARALNGSVEADGKPVTPPQTSAPDKKARLVFPPAAAQPALLRIGGTAVEGALTAADYLAENQTPENASFRNTYRTRYGIDPDNWAGLGFAAGQLAAEAVRNAGPSPDADTMRIALERINNLPSLLGAGPWRQDALRNPSYAPQLYEVRQGNWARIPAARLP